MKGRLGHVANSSSSSFTCDICGNDVSGMDLCLSEAEMFECENGHTVCQSHMKKDIYDFDLEEKKNYLIKKGYELDDLKTEEDIEKMWGQEDLYYELSEGYCPVCTFDEVYDSTLLDYVLNKYNMTRKEILNELKNKFKSYKEFIKSLN